MSAVPRTLKPYDQSQYVETLYATAEGSEASRLSAAKTLLAEYGLSMALDAIYQLSLRFPSLSLSCLQLLAEREGTIYFDRVLLTSQNPQELALAGKYFQDRDSQWKTAFEANLCQNCPHKISDCGWGNCPNLHLWISQPS